MGKEFDFNSLQVIVLDSPYDQLTDPDAQKLFASLMALKVTGYGQVHGTNPLPFATCDFIGTHLIVSDKSDPFGKIYMAYKSVSLAQCQRFNLDFPFLSILQKAQNPTCWLEMKNVIADCQAKGQDISYDTGWTIHPGVREIPELQNLLKEIVPTFVTNHHRDYNIPNWVTFGICKVKTDQFFLKMGLAEISQEPLISHPYLGNVPARAVIARGQYSAYFHETAEKYQWLWDKRLTLSAKTKETKKAA